MLVLHLLCLLIHAGVPAHGVTPLCLGWVFHVSSPNRDNHLGHGVRVLSVGVTTLFLCFRKYVQVCVQNLSELDFELSDSNLEDKGHATDLRLAPLNTQSQQVTVSALSTGFSAGQGRRPE